MIVNIANSSTAAAISPGNGATAAMLTGAASEVSPKLAARQET
jgi:hypothetical protein